MERRELRSWLVLGILVVAWLGFGLFAKTVLDPWSRDVVQRTCEEHGETIGRTGATYVPLHRDKPAVAGPVRTSTRFNFNGGWCAYDGTGPEAVVLTSDLGLGTQGLTMLHGYGLAGTLVGVPVGVFFLALVVSSRMGRRRTSRGLAPAG